MVILVQSKTFMYAFKKLESTIFIIHGFRDSVPVGKMQHCYQDTQKFRANVHSNPSDTRRLQCVDVNNPPEKVFISVYAVYTYPNRW